MKSVKKWIRRYEGALFLIGGTVLPWGLAFWAYPPTMIFFAVLVTAAVLLVLVLSGISGLTRMRREKHKEHMLEGIVPRGYGVYRLNYPRLI